jgi:hypothetical protein
MAKAEKAKAKKRAKPKLTDKEQSERFIEAARELGIEEVGNAFNKAIETIIRQKSKTSTS